MKYTKERLVEAARNSDSIHGVIRYLGANSGSGGVFQHIKKKLVKYQIDMTHFVGLRANLGKSPTNKKRPEEILVKNADPGYRLKADQLRRAMLESGIEHKCAICSMSNIWNGSPLVLQVDHINGDWRDNRKENVRFLCPNCHSQI